MIGHTNDSTAAFHRLVKLGSEKGGLTVADLQKALPVDIMTAGELADVLARLEDAGIPIEIDAALLAPRYPELGLRDASPAIEASRYNDQAAADRVRLSRLASSLKHARERPRAPFSQARMYIQMPSAVFIGIAVLALIIFASVVWLFA